MAGYWIAVNGRNLLKGVPGDADNPPRLTDVAIVNALQSSVQARVEFDQIFDALLPEEQDRLRTLVEDNPRITQLKRDYGSFLDDVQKRQVTQVVRTVGPRGGLGGANKPVGKVI